MNIHYDIGGGGGGGGGEEGGEEGGGGGGTLSGREEHCRKRNSSFDIAPWNTATSSTRPSAAVQDHK